MLRPFAALLACLFVTATAHMELSFPAPFNSSGNSHRTTDSDPYLQYPYDCCGPGARWTYPCRGYTSLLGTTDGLPTAIWAAGSTQNFSLTGIGNHYGGSCQVGFSTDAGETFRVVTSYEGNCPHRNGGDGPDGQSFNFTVPEDVEEGVQVFAWTWFNREQEFNMNCAAVNITAGTPTSGSGRGGYSALPIPTTATGATYTTANNCTCICDSPTNISTCTCSCPPASPSPSSTPASTSPAVAFSDRPLMFVADTGNGCLTPHTTAELKFPDPGPEIVEGDGVYPLGLPEGTCGRRKFDRQS